MAQGQGKETKVKKWLKKHWRLTIVIVYLLALANGINGIIAAMKSGNDIFLVVHVLGSTLFLTIILWLSGIAKKIYIWWQKD